MRFLGTHWQEPAWLLILPIVFFIWLTCFKQRTTRNHWQLVCEPHLLPHLLIGEKHRKQQWPWALLVLSWLLATIALANPSWHKKPSRFINKNKPMLSFLTHHSRC